MKMKTKIFTLTLAFICMFNLYTINAQTTAMDFNRADCNGNMQHLFADLDAGNAVVLEFFMRNCASCVNAGNDIMEMEMSILNEFPGKLKAYSIGYTNSYSKTQVLDWVNTNGFTHTVPMDSGATQVAYYGGFGMPTIVILGGSDHKILGSTYVGFSTSDTTQMGIDIRTFLNTATSIKSSISNLNSLSIFPNPAANNFNISFELKENANVKIDLYDLSGKLISNLTSEEMNIGNINKSFSTSSLQSGYYIVSLNVNGAISKQSLIVTN